MNLMTIIGNAVADQDFLEALFADPTETVERYGFRLTVIEKEALLFLMTGKGSKERKQALQAAASAFVCPETPCANFHAVAPPDKKAVNTERPKVA